MKLSLVMAVGASLLVSSHALGWNNRGHMMVAAVAWDQLDEETQERATELLKLNPHYKMWIKGVAADERDKIAFVKAATWPDFIRGLVKDPDDKYEDDGSDPEASPVANQNIGYDDKNLHRYWHFADLPFTRDGTATMPPKAPNAVTQIVKFRDTIASSTASDELKSYDLAWVLHLVGDIHQPLHATARFSSLSPTGDRGGNDVKLCEKPCKNNLHSFWDAAGGTGNSPTAAIKAAEELAEASSAEAAISDPQKWANESFEISKASVYRSPIGASNGPFEITDSYKKRARSIAEDRIALAGARLAKLLTDFLK